MSKRFVDTAKYRQAWRKLDPKLRAAYYWLTENCDPAGFWVIDLEHFKFECGYVLDLDRLLTDIAGAVERHGTNALRMVDFIEVNYGSLREGYNPHKPALRALATSTLTETKASLKQASSKLEDEEEDEGEEEDNSLGKEPARVFEPAWEAYGRHGHKLPALKAWAKLTNSDRDACLTAVPAYVKATNTDGTFPSRQHFATYLNGRTWEDAVPTRNNSGELRPTGVLPSKTFTEEM